MPISFEVGVFLVFETRKSFAENQRSNGDFYGYFRFSNGEIRASGDRSVLGNRMKNEFPNSKKCAKK